VIVLLFNVLEGPAGALLAAVFQGIVVGVVVIPGKFLRVSGLCILWVLVGPILSFYSLGFYLFLWVLSWFCWGVILYP
jgi:hypothetical protein